MTTTTTPNVRDIFTELLERSNLNLDNESDSNLLNTITGFYEDIDKNELGMAKNFARHHKNFLRYCDEHKKWYYKEIPTLIGNNHLLSGTVVKEVYQPISAATVQGIATRH